MSVADGIANRAYGGHSTWAEMRPYRRRCTFQHMHVSGVTFAAQDRSLSITRIEPSESIVLVDFHAQIIMNDDTDRQEYALVR